MYQVLIRKSAKKDFKRLPKQLQAKVKQKTFKEIAKNPWLNRGLSGSFKGLKKVVLRYQGVEYRIVYYILKDDKIALVIMLGTRENFYQKLKRRLK